MSLIFPAPRVTGGRSWRGYNALQIAQLCGMTQGLEICLDSGDAASYTSGQSWMDLSGNGHDFFLGADGSATATDPTFNGTPGNLSAAEYWSFDGGDFFRYDTTNAAFMNTWHKDSAKFSMGGMIYLAALTSIQTILATETTAVRPGILVRINTTGTLNILVSNDAGTISNLNSSGALVSGAWAYWGISVDEAASSFSFIANDTASTTGHSYASPSANDPTAQPLTIGSIASVAASGTILSGGRMGPLVIWDQVAWPMDAHCAFGRALRWRFNA